MFRFSKDGEILETVNNPVWVKQQKNGCFALCSQEEADGVVIGGNVYDIAQGKTLWTEKQARGTLDIQWISESDYYREQEARKTATETAIAELSILFESLKGGVFDV